MSAVPMIQEVLYPGEDVSFIHRAELLQGPEDPSPGQPFDPPQYVDFTNWTADELISIKPPAEANRIRRTRMPTEFGAEIYQAGIEYTGPRTEGRVVVLMRKDQTALAQGYTELFGELWLTNQFSQRRHMANLRYVVENSVNPVANA